MLRRKIDKVLIDWKKRSNRKPLIVKGARQIGKTMSIRHFAEQNYKHIVEINFALEDQYCRIFENGFNVDSIIKNITLINPHFEFVPGETLIFFDEIQACPSCATSLKPFKLDGRYDVICSGSLMGVYYQQIESNSVGYKEDIVMHSLDFEEFLWACGYDDSFIEDLFTHMHEVKPVSGLMMSRLEDLFRDYMVLGGGKGQDSGCLSSHFHISSTRE